MRSYTANIQDVSRGKCGNFIHVLSTAIDCPNHNKTQTLVYVLDNIWGVYLLIWRIIHILPFILSLGSRSKPYNHIILYCYCCYCIHVVSIVMVIVIYDAVTIIIVTVIVLVVVVIVIIISTILILIITMFSKLSSMSLSLLSSVSLNTSV